MLHKGNRTKGGTMPADVMEKVDGLLDEFVSFVDRISGERHLQRGIARASMPCKLVLVMDRENLWVLAQFASGNLSSMYLCAPETKIKADKALSSAKWEFGFEDPFVLQFPLSLLDGGAGRAEALEEIASAHVESEFKRFMGIINLLRTRPVFGPAPFAPDDKLIHVAMPTGEGSDRVYQVVEKAADSNKLSPSRYGDVRSDLTKVREMWLSLSMARLFIADLRGQDPDVMYQLGVAHTLGKETIIVYPHDVAVPLDLPQTTSIAYDGDSSGLEMLEFVLGEAIRSAVGPLTS